jgi:PHD/YefM family antitoxin component YafN of YafNO toxin-antitoxin module
MAGNDIQFVSDENGKPVGVFVPIELWREIESERETAHLLGSETMRRRLAEAKNRQEGVPFEEACDRLGV